MRSLLPLAALLLAACDGASAGPADGPLALGIVSGNHQTATAGADRLPEPVVGKMVRTPGGGIAFHLVTPAYAQGTVVTGSPVPGAVVCAVSVTEGGMVPFTPCTNTDANGQATFFFSPGTRAGEARSEIRGTVAGAPAVFDTAVAEVQPGPVARLVIQNAAGTLQTAVSVGDTIDIRDYLQSAQDAYGNEIAPDTARAIANSRVHSGWNSRMAGTPSVDYAHATMVGWRVVVPDTTGYQLFQGTYPIRLTAYVDGVLNSGGNPQGYEISFGIKP